MDAHHCFPLTLSLCSLAHFYTFSLKHALHIAPAQSSLTAFHQPLRTATALVPTHLPIVCTIKQVPTQLQNTPLPTPPSGMFTVQQPPECFQRAAVSQEGAEGQEPAPPPPTPLTTTSLGPRTGQALATPRLHPVGSQKGDVVLTAPPVQLSPSPTGSRALELETGDCIPALLT